MNALAIVAREVARIRRDDRLLTGAGVIAWCAGGVASGALLLADGRWITLPPSTPVLWWVGLLVGLLGIAWRAHRWSGQRTAPLTVGAGIEAEQGLRRGALVGVLELAATRDPLVEAAAAQLGARLAAVEGGPMPGAMARRRRALGLVSGTMVLALAGLGTVAATRPDGWRAMRRPIAAARGTLLAPLVFDALPLGVARGSALTVELRAAARRDVAVRWRTIGTGWRDTSIAIDAAGRGRLALARVEADLLLVATDGRMTSDTARVRALDRPFLGEVRLLATYPAYLGRPAETLDPALPVVLPEGTVLSLEGRASEPLASVALAMVDPATRFTLTVDGARFRGRITPPRSGILTWAAEGRATTIADLPAPLVIELVPDAAPRVSIVSPEGSVRADASERIPLEIVAEDDHGLRAIALRREEIDPAGRSAPAVESVLASGSDGAWVGGVTLDLAALAMMPGARLRIVAVAREVGPRARVAVSAPLEIMIPTADEVRAAARALGDSTAAAATAAARTQAALAERTEMAARQRGDRAAMSEAGAERAREIAAQQREVQARAASLETSAQAMEERLRQAGVLDTTLARQLQDAQRLLREALAGGVDGAVQQLEAARESMDADRTRQSLADLAAQQQRMREALERTSRLLQRAALEGAMRTTADQAAALAQDQRRFADSLRAGRARGAEADPLARRSAALAQATEAMAQRLAAARAQTGARGAQEAAEATRRAEAALREGASETAAQAAEGAAATLEATVRAQQAEWRGAVTEALDRSVQELLQLAREQEALAQAARAEATDPGMRGRQSAVQQGVQAAQQRVAEQARQSALVSPRSQQLMASAQQQVAEASREAGQVGSGVSATRMREAATALREAAAQLTRDRERAAVATSASGLPELLQQLREAAQQQGAMNGQLQGLLSTARAAGRSGTEGLDAQGQAQARALARAQREVARALDEAADADPSGRAAEMAREARGVAQQLDQGIVTPATEQRLARLLGRMLDAGRALEQETRDQTPRREARAADRATARVVPGRTAPGAAAARYATPSWAELRALSAEERTVVLEYFRRLNAERAP